MEVLYIMWYGITAGMSTFFGTVMVFLVGFERKGDFFNFEKSFFYNMDGFNVIAAPILAGLGAIVSYSVYKDFRDEAEEEARRPMAGPGHGYGAMGADDPAFVAPPPPQRQQQEFQPFQGSGHRLGEGPNP